MKNKNFIILALLAVLLPAASYGFTKIFDNLDYNMNVYSNNAFIPDGSGYMLIGSDYYYDYGYALKVDASGDCVWTRTLVNYGLTGGVKMPNGHYMFSAVSYLSPEPAIMETDASGNCVWVRAIADGNTYPNVIEGASDGGFIFAGRGFGAASESQMYVEKLDASGNCVWARSYYQYMTPKKAINSGDGGYIICGIWSGYGVLMKLDAAGNSVWTKSTDTSWTSASVSYAWFNDVVSTGDGYIVTGTSDPTGDYNNIIAIKTKPNGDVLWEKVYGWGMSHNANSITYTGGNGDYGCLIAGSMAPDNSGTYQYDFDLFVMQLDAAGNCRNVSAVHDPVYALYDPHIIDAGRGKYVLSADTYDPFPHEFFYLTGGSFPAIVSAPLEGSQVEAGKENYAWPQPAVDTVKFVYALDSPAEVTINIFNFANRLVGKNTSNEPKDYPADNNVTTAVDIKKLPAGVYFYQIVAKHPGGKTTRYTPGRFMVKK